MDLEIPWKWFLDTSPMKANTKTSPNIWKKRNLTHLFRFTCFISKLKIINFLLFNVFHLSFKKATLDTHQIQIRAVKLILTSVKNLITTKFCLFNEIHCPAIFNLIDWLSIMEPILRWLCYRKGRDIVCKSIHHFVQVNTNHWSIF